MAEYENDLQYTKDSLIEQLALVQTHLSDGSWRKCTCIPKKHRPLLHGFSIEGKPMSREDRGTFKKIEAYSKKLVNLAEDKIDGLYEEAWKLRHELGDEKCETGKCPVTDSGGKTFIRGKSDGIIQEFKNMRLPANARVAGQVVGGVVVGVALDKGAEWVDGNVDLFKTQPVYFKAQFLTEAIGGTALLLSGLYGRPRAMRPVHLVALSAGSFLLIVFALNQLPKLGLPIPTASAKFTSEPVPASLPVQSGLDFN